MRILTYKRTHTGDPDNRGVFGINDCMGTVRNRVFDAVVGIGSKTPWPDATGIAGKITWVGVGPFRMHSSMHRGDLVAFEKFVLLDAQGPSFEQLAPNLSRRFYEGGARSILSSYSPTEKEELQSLIAAVLERGITRTNFAPDFDKLEHRRQRCRKFFCNPCDS
ncbi:hypothetical protein Q9252_00050 [Marinobacter salarius]|uniref:hypothetical protein n=1 Tax=Marinobacter salarius TaxID=1420917 RepID=UPI00273C9399|nr:hypothetical protein [Marinobacter salarius]MDP4530507.1 hypothetical protein [Marinobacter salarius]